MHIISEMQIQRTMSSPLTPSEKGTYQKDRRQLVFTRREQIKNSHSGDGNVV